ncbi:MAG: ATPase domain-containing protein [Candidatus Bathyarchaeia archaeon]|jgi:archaellum biogenesis ATPase FlaH
MQRVSTGIIGLDQLLRGGLPAGSMSLVFGVSGSGKNTMGKQFLYEPLIRKTPALLMDTNGWLRMASSSQQQTTSVKLRLNLSMFRDKSNINR